MQTTLSTYEQKEIRIKSLQALIDIKGKEIAQKQKELRELEKRLEEVKL